MDKQHWSEETALGRFLSHNKGIVIVLLLSLLAVGVYFYRKRVDTTALKHALIRAGARVEEVPSPTGQLYLDVNFAGVPLGDRELNLLVQLDSIAYLDLSGTGLDDHGLARLMKLTALLDLQLDNTKITDDGLKVLRKLPVLQRLDLRGCTISNEGLPALTNIARLTDLSLVQTSITDEGLTHLAKARNLKTLQLGSTAITDAGIEALQSLPGLEDLDLSSTRITDAGLSGLSSLAGLQALRLSGTKITDAGIRTLGTLAQLRKLDLSMVAVTDKGMANLASLTRLRELELRMTGITDAGVVHLRQLPIKKLVLSFTSITDKALDVVKEMKDLEYLAIDGHPFVMSMPSEDPEKLAKLFKQFSRQQPFSLSTHITDKGMERLKSLTGLRELYLDGASLTDAGVAHFAGLTRMRRLHLGNSKLTDAGLKHLAGMTDLRELHLHNTGLKGTGFEHLKGLTNLRRLMLYNTEIDDAGVQHLLPLKDLRELYLGGTPITDKALETIAEIPLLRHLELSDTRIGDAGLAHLAGLRRLHQLNLNNTRITDAGLEHLRDLPELAEIQARQTRVSKAAAEAFLDKTPPVRVFGPRELEASSRPGREQVEWSPQVDKSRLDHSGEPLTKGIRARLGTKRLYFPGEGQHLRFTPDGKTVITGSRSSQVYVWDTGTGRLRHILRTKEDRLQSLAVSPSGQLATTGSGGLVQIWDTMTGKVIRELQGSWSFAPWMEFVPDGNGLLMLQYPSAVVGIDARTGDEMFSIRGKKQGRSSPGEGEHFMNLSVAPDGKTFAASVQKTTLTRTSREIDGQKRDFFLSAHKNMIRVWEFPSGKPLAEMALVDGEGGAVTYAHAGRTLVISGRDGTVTLREARTGKEIRKISFDDRKQLFRLHHVLPDGKTLAIWAGDRWQTWDLDTGKRRGEILLEETHFVSSPDGKTLATLTAGHLVLWDRDPLKERFPLVRHKGLLDGSSLRYAPDGKTILTAGRDRTIRIWDRQGHEKKVLAVADLNMQAMTISRDGQFLAVLGAPIERAEKAPRTILRVWEGPAERAIFETPIELSTYRSILGPVFGPRGMVVVAKTSYPMMPGLSKLLKPPPDGTSTALLHDTRSKNEPRQIPLGILSINDLAISPDGELLVWASDAGTVGIVNLATGKELRRLTVPARSEKERTGPVEIAFSVDSKRMAISRGEKGIVLVDPVRKGEVQTLAGPGKCPPITIRFMPDGRLLAAGQTSIETTSGTAADISVWDVVTGKLVRPPWRTEEAIELKLSPDGAELAVAHASAVVELWPLTDEKR